MADRTKEEKYALLRSRMVDEQLVRRGISDPGVLAAMRAVPRHLFIPEKYRADAYRDSPVPIGSGQTISQPYIVASMTEELALDHASTVLEIGTGCGYQTAVLAEIAGRVYSIERLPDLHELACATLGLLRYDRVNLRLGDGYRGWAEEAPFDGIIVTAAAPRIPERLTGQLSVGGRLILPVGSEFGRQELVLIERTATGLVEKVLYEVRFVPMQGDSQA
ncbi:MAG TPA: protein-L-isoaspartate(D-aspartate) O-methyltransferase [candidate division Zixibacteria bacterium]|nr:protein-L-isoaspartate(D-aspartate) O-methyltransferase [candidate division Zixibacteria bacterium]MDD4918858.1 protein-L-isoaspartate(D-aspartate) O-methyltransferase [candidate division Zixibacteria bacterium]MDM7972878.1 protein-L-isoaspartate(D-aspartate) O-methyltransferase [candidate division Zixibacteria bacterium]HOZ08213.1 protein-L-isoaspartate(D-aspartate) O-methyltransferase [candidate division Zixibacteria bacterium]HPC11207.1 protein-L-isoaspartate(D-aspartate) O-methyltransfer